MNREPHHLRPLLCCIAPLAFALGGCVPGANDRSEAQEPTPTPASEPAKPAPGAKASDAPASRQKPEEATKPEVVVRSKPEPTPPPEVLGTYSWHDQVDPKQTIVARVPTPRGYRRVEAPPKSFANWLRTLPVKPGHPQVHLYDGSLKGNQSAQELVIDMDVGKFDLQQCADAVMRLRAEYLYSENRFQAIHFNFTTGDRASYFKWRQGYRPKVVKNKVSWGLTGPATTTYQGFRSYLQSVFTYAGTASLTRELSTKTLEEITPGDVFIRGGFPGHAVLVMDVARDEKGEHPLFLLAQSYMPAQEMHLLRNPKDAALSPWYSIHFGESLETPEWTFKPSELKSFKDQ